MIVTARYNPKVPDEEMKMLINDIFYVGEGRSPTNDEIEIVKGVYGQKIVERVKRIAKKMSENPSIKMVHCDPENLTIQLVFKDNISAKKVYDGMLLDPYVKNCTFGEPSSN